MEAISWKRKEKALTPSVANMFKAKEENGLFQHIMEAETIMCELIAQYNLPVASSDKFTKGFKSMFPDSKIAHGFQCGRTQTTAVPGELSADQQKTLFGGLQKGPFSTSTDGSNDTAGDKQFSLLVRSVGKNLTLQSELLAVPTCKGSATGELNYL
ncbi:hypothetical protein PoB_002952300 [Plakobranchus ocellatus]|uniref:Uncharacterized protein n=1 Tax=Plakobranchus ocellatus TaxID=259542 RepID=A0AAV4A8E7_9GAST|nr:hypothetical protein PoB_002952300 [Plakobranchus ocellatus]